MSGSPAVLFFQKRSHRAGAQTSLVRMLRSRSLAHICPVVLLGTDGWLVHEFARRETLHLVMPFPSSRALTSRLLGLGGFAEAVKRELVARGIQPAAVFANDHQECPLALAVSKVWGGIPVIGLLRSVGMKERDFQKYRCGDCHTLLCVGETLRGKVRSWTGSEPALFEEGFGDDEFHSPRELSREFPERILVIGNEDPGKGFLDFIEAVDWIESRHPEFPALRCEFTGSAPGGSDAFLAKKRRAEFRFPGRLENLQQRLADYPLVVHPSRGETFGLAPIEALLAGTPTLASATGIFGKLDYLERWRFPVRDPEALAGKLVETWQTWPACFSELGEVQRKLRASFHIDDTVQSIKRALTRCGIG